MEPTTTTISAAATAGSDAAPPKVATSLVLPYSSGRDSPRRYRVLAVLVGLTGVFFGLLGVLILIGSGLLLWAEFKSDPYPGVSVAMIIGTLVLGSVACVASLCCVDFAGKLARGSR